MDVWSKINGQIVLCGVKTEVRNRGHSYCGVAKQIKMVWMHLEEG